MRKERKEGFSVEEESEGMKERKGEGHLRIDKRGKEEHS